MSPIRLLISLRTCTTISSSSTASFSLAGELREIQRSSSSQDGITALYLLPRAGKSGIPVPGSTITRLLSNEQSLVNRKVRAVILLDPLHKGFPLVDSMKRSCGARIAARDIVQLRPPVRLYRPASYCSAAPACRSDGGAIQMSQEPGPRTYLVFRLISKCRCSTFGPHELFVAVRLIPVNSMPA
jgi:hypothetical protein